MPRTLPIPAWHPPAATRTAAGQVVTLAGAPVVAVQAAASITLAALLWPLIPAARAGAGLASALGQRLPLRPLPEQQGVVMPGPDGPRRCLAAQRGRCARRGHAGGGGRVRAPGPGHRRPACRPTAGQHDDGLTPPVPQPGGKPPPGIITMAKTMTTPHDKLSPGRSGAASMTTFGPAPGKASK